MTTARQAIRQAARAQHGDIRKAAIACGIDPSTLYRFFRGGGLSLDTAGRLRAGVHVADAVWADLVAPLPPARPEHTDAST